MSAKDKNLDVFSYFKKVKAELRARHHTISLNKGLSDTSSHCVNVNVCMLERTLEKEN